MKIPISFGFVLILMTIALVMIMGLGSYPESTSLGILIGQLLMAGIFMLNHGFTYDTKKRRFIEW